MTAPAEATSTDNSTPADATARPESVVSIPAATLLALRAALLTRPDLETVFVLRDAGFAAGDALFEAFRVLVKSREGVEPGDLDVERFFQLAGEFWTASGWGPTSFAAHDDAFCAVEMSGCWEADPEHQPDPRGCHLTVGMLGAFLGRFADYPVAVLETDGPASGSEVCRFIAGSTERIADYYATHS